MKRFSLFFALLLFCGFMLSCDEIDANDPAITGNVVDGSNETVDTIAPDAAAEVNSNVKKMTAAQQKEFFRTYVAIGDSLTHGCQGLNVEENRQYYSWPAQLARAIGTEFNQPLIEYPGVGIPNPEDGFREGWYDTWTGTLTKMTKTLLYWYRVDRYKDQPRLNNFGITGATLDQVMTFNPAKIIDYRTPWINDFVGLFSPFVRSTVGLAPQNCKSAVDQALDRDPTFITIWIGNNDTMYATIMGDTALLTSLKFWKQQWETLVAKIKAKKSVRGVLVVNLPDNTAIPFLQPINNKYHTVAEGSNIPAGSKVPFFVTKSKYVSEVITPEQLKKIQDMVLVLNEIIEDTCEKENWAMVDSYTIFKYEIPAHGMRLIYGDGTESDIVLTDEYGIGGIFSLDGIHPTSTGYSRVANTIAREINSHYGATIPLIDEVAVWEKDSLCQDPFDPRETDPVAMGNMSYLTNTLFRMMSQLL